MTKVMTCLYFAYGSNLLASRMHVQNPTASRAGIARLDDHRLDFNFKSQRWGGHAATIVPDPGRHVWGALWEVTDVQNLDNQEGVSEFIYEVRNVTVFKPDNTTVQCRAYQLVDLPVKENAKLPSRVYLETIIQGAIESGIPIDYIKYLKNISHNGFEGPVKIPSFKINFTETSSYNHYEGV